MRKQFCCDASRGMYEDYYVSQSGNGMPVFQGWSGQRGHGLGSMLSGLFRGALPMLKRGLAVFGKQALKTGLEVANDVADGESWSDSARRRIPVGLKTGIKRFANWQDGSDQTGNGLRGRRGRKIKRSKITRKHKPKKARRDIFD